MKVYNLVKLLPAFLLSYPVVCIYYNRYISVRATKHRKTITN
ncbi:MAG: hypothetical protein JWR18_3616 [Segetibacter sp.]|nr:hypothetical protein [Segetibacter sp.]